MTNKLIHFIAAFITVSICVFLFIDWVIMPIYIRKDKTVRLIDVKNKNLDRAVIELESEGLKGWCLTLFLHQKLIHKLLLTNTLNPGKKLKKDEQ